MSFSLKNSIPFPVMVVAFIVLLLVSLIIATGTGNVVIANGEVFKTIFLCPFDNQCEVSSLYQRIIWDIRFPRVLMALLTGVGLSITGAILQSVTRNPLADPYLFGISSGSALGAVLVLSAFSGAIVSVTIGALMGGIFSVILMLTLAGSAVTQVERLLLSGVAVSFMLGAFTSLVIYYSDPNTASSLLFWMMGSFSNSEWHQLILPAITITVGLIIFIIYRGWIGAIQAGDEGAFTLGVPVNQLRLAMLIVCSLITAVLVSQVGGIGFVGLMIPHICRFMVGAQLHRVLILCVLLGGSFMIWVDVVARTLLQDQVLPIGIVTSVIGSLFFFIVLKSNRSS